jgi:hypothetical protein
MSARLSATVSDALRSGPALSEWAGIHVTLSRSSGIASALSFAAWRPGSWSQEPSYRLGSGGGHSHGLWSSPFWWFGLGLLRLVPSPYSPPVTTRAQRRFWRLGQLSWRSPLSVTASRPSSIGSWRSCSLSGTRSSLDGVWSWLFARPRNWRAQARAKKRLGSRGGWRSPGIALDRHELCGNSSDDAFRVGKNHEDGGRLRQSAPTGSLEASQP